MFALLDGLRQIDENILTHVQTHQLREAGHGGGNVTELVVGQAQVLQSVAVEERSGGGITDNWVEREDGYLGRSLMLLQSSLSISRVLS